MANKNNNTQPIVHHRVRTFFAAICGIIALDLIFFSILVVWLNRTVTDTNTYVKTVAPLVTKPAIQNFVASKVTDQILQQGTPQDLASKLLTADQSANKTPEQLTAQLTNVINSSVLQIVRSSAFASEWRTTNQSAHAALISQLNSNATHLTIDLSPLINSVLTQLKTTQLSPIADKITTDDSTGKLDLKGQGVSSAHHYYKLFQEATLIIVALTVVAIGSSVWLSVHHLKTLRRIVFGTGLMSLGLAAILELPVLVKLNGTDAVTQNAARAVAVALFHNLQLTALIVGVLCIVGAVASKVYVKKFAK